MDKVRCSRGKSLLELCIQSRLRLLNGRSFGDTMGRFTAHCSLDSSVIDYFIASEDIQNKFVSFYIHEFKKSLSNHCMLSCLLKVNFTEVKELTYSSNIAIPVKYIWTERSVTEFQEALQRPNIASKIDTGL